MQVDPSYLMIMVGGALVVSLRVILLSSTII